MITKKQAIAWSRRFPSRLANLWTVVRTLAMELSQSQPQHKALLTHSFLYAVGNFKRQTPMFPAELVGHPETASWEAPIQVDLWNGIEVHRDLLATWTRLDAIPGVGIPTATTALAALWPTKHAILDSRTVQAAVALRGAEGSWDGPVSAESGHSSRPPPFRRETWINWTTYEWYRDRCVLPTSVALGIAPQSVERALFELVTWQLQYDQASPTESWHDYGVRLRGLLDHPPQHDG